MSDKKPTLSRRNFLMTVGAGGAAGAAAMVARTGAVPAAGPVAESKREGQGYKLTEHVGNYYRTTKV